MNGPAAHGVTCGGRIPRETAGGTATISVVAYDLANLRSESLRTVTMPPNPRKLLYDPCGNLTNDGSRVFTWDAENRLLSVESLLEGPLAAAKKRSVFRYDGFGRRVETVEYSGWSVAQQAYQQSNLTRYAYAGWQVLADMDATGTVVRSYAYGPGVDNILAMTIHTGAVQQTYFYLKDHLNTVQALVDGNGQVVESYRLDVWGRVLGIHDASGSAIASRQSAIGNRYLFQGREYSWSTGLYYFRYRWYEPAVGRWLSPDPSGMSGGLNQYVFCANNPANSIDPLGLADVEVIFVSDNTVWGDLFMHWLEGEGAYVIRVTSPQDMIDQAQAFCGRTGHRIREWGLSGHAFRAGVQTLAGKDNEIDPARFTRGQVRAMRRLLSGPEARYTTWACHGGNQVQDLQMIADLYNITAQGWPRNVKSGRWTLRSDYTVLDWLVHWYYGLDLPDEGPPADWIERHPSSSIEACP